MNESILNQIPSKILERNLQERKRLENVNQMILSRMLKICLNKNLQIEVRPALNLVTVNNETFTFKWCCYYKGNLSNFQDSNTLNLDNLLEEVKKYKV